MTKGEPGEKTRGKHFSTGKHIFKTLLCPERENSISCFWCGKSGKISSLHALTLKSREGQGISWGFCLINHWGFGKCILLLGLHWCLSKVTHLSKTRKPICSPAQKLLRWLVLFNCDFFLAILPASKFYLMCLLSLTAFRHHPNLLFPREAALLIAFVDTDHTLCSAQSYSPHSVSPSQSASAEAPRKSWWCPLSIYKLNKFCLWFFSSLFFISDFSKATYKRQQICKAQVLQQSTQVQRELQRRRHDCA